MAISRRDLFERGGLLALGTMAWPSWMPRMAFRRQDVGARGDVLVVVFARGGHDGLNMVIPFGEESTYYSLRRTIGIPAPDSTAPNKAVDLDGFFGMHPSLATSALGNWKQWYDDGMLAIVHAMHMEDGTRSHFDAMDYMERGTPGEKQLNTGWLGRHLSTMATQNNSPFRAVGMGTMLQASLRGPVPAVALQSIADFHLQGRTDEILRFQQHLQQLYGGTGWLDVEGQDTFKALDLLEQQLGSDTYQPQHGARYVDTDGFHRGLKQIAQLIKADVGLEIACIDIGGWDTHANQVDGNNPALGSQANLLNSLARGLDSFMTDLRDYWAEPGVTVVTMSEFGRRAGENGGRGTDHGHGNCMFVLGKGINGGQVYTRPWPTLAPDALNQGDLAGTTEYRDVVGEILMRRVGNEKISEVFPAHSFNFLGLAKPRDVTVPTPAPSNTPEPTAIPTAPAPQHKIYLPWGNKT